MRLTTLLALLALPALVEAQNTLGYYPSGLARYDLSNSESIAAMGVQPDGKVVVAAWGGHTHGHSIEMNILRLASDGTLDLGVRTHFGQEATYADVLVLQNDGKILVAGLNYGDPSSNSGLALARINADGGFDASFGNGGHVLTPLGDAFEVTNMLVESDGTILVAGHFSGEAQVYVLRYSSSGDLDASSGTGGLLPADQALLASLGMGARPPTALSSTVVQPDGRVITEGPGFTVERRNPDGSLDQSFGDMGRAQVGFPRSTYDEFRGMPILAGPPDYSIRSRGMVLQPDGGIVVGTVIEGFPSDLAFYRFTADGTLDRAGACSDPETAPFYGGGFEVVDYQALVKVITPVGGARYEFYNTRNLYVEPPGAFAYRSDRLESFPGQMQEQGDTFTFTAGSTQPGVLYFPIMALDPDKSNRVAFFLRVTDGCGRTVDVDPAFTLATADERGDEFSLAQSQPNPARDQATIEFSLDRAAEARLTLYDALGREVAVLIDRRMESGAHAAPVDVSALPSGVYVYRLASEGRTRTGRLVVAR